MNYDGLVLAAVVSELKKTIIGGRVQRVRQHNDRDITLEIRGMGQTHLLFFSVDPRFARVYLTASSLPVPGKAPQFCMVMRKHVEGAVVVSVDQIGFDRVLEIVFRAGGDEKRLILELMGKHSNLVLTDGSGRVLDAMKHIGPSVSRYRQMLPGRDYLPPPDSGKIDIRRLDDAGIAEIVGFASVGWSCEDDARDWLVQTLSGFGPVLAGEVVARAGTDPESAKRELSRIRDIVRDDAWEPVFVTDPRGRDLLVYPIRCAQYPNDWQHSRFSYNQAIDAYFLSLVTRTLLEDERAQVLALIRRAEAARCQTLKSLDRTVEESGRADEYRKLGELLTASLHAIPKGASSVRVVDYYDPKMPEIKIELDSKLTPYENAERYFKRFQKVRDAASVAVKRRETIQREIDQLEASREEAEKLKAVDALRSLRADLVARGLLRDVVKVEERADEFGGERIKRVVTPEGWEILYGETSRANDYLTQRLARPNDVWLHARSVTGAHVVIRTSGSKAEAPHEVLLTAAKIAALNSDARHSSLVAVDYTLRKYVRKPHGSAPGYVTYRNEKTIDISPQA